MEQTTIECSSTVNIPRYTEYYQENREAILLKRKARYETKKDELRAYQKEYNRKKRAAAKLLKMNIVNSEA